MTLAEQKEQLNQKLRELDSFDILNDSNFKFMNLLRSRLNEEGIPLDIAGQIVSNISYDLSAVNEDDDYIGDVALTYAEFAGKVYARLEATGWHRHMTAEVINKFFNKIDLKL